MVKQLQEIVTLKDETKKQEMVAHFLETEGTTADLEEDCKERVNTLQGKESVILVAGKRVWRGGGSDTHYSFKI